MKESDCLSFCMFPITYIFRKLRLFTTQVNMHNIWAGSLFFFSFLCCQSVTVSLNSPQTPLLGPDAQHNIWVALNTGSSVSMSRWQVRSLSRDHERTRVDSYDKHSLSWLSLARGSAEYLNMTHFGEMLPCWTWAVNRLNSPVKIKCTNIAIVKSAEFV